MTSEVIDAQAHLARCEECRGFMRDMQASREAVRAAAPREEAPPEVRRRLFAALARARAGSQAEPARWRSGYWVGAAAAVLLALGLALAGQYFRQPATADPLAVLAEDHMRTLGEAQIASSDPVVISRWIAGQVHFAMLVPALPNAALRGARLRVVDGRRGAVVLYDVNGAALSYFVVPDGDGSAGALPGAGAARFERTSRAGYRVVAWREPGLLHAMIARLPDSQLVTLAEACMKQARNAVASLGSKLLATGG